VSDVQRRQMTTVDAPNVHNVAVEGTFDDCQDLVKAMFADEPFRETCGCRRSTRINWARVMAQVVYYVAASLALGGGPGGRPVAFSVPTGNFGNVLAGWVARGWACRSHQLVIGRTATTSSPASSTPADAHHPGGAHAQPEHGHPGVEQLRAAPVRAEPPRRRQMQRFRATGALTVEPDQYDELCSLFVGSRLDDDQTLAEMARIHAECGLLVDPHTAVGWAPHGSTGPIGPSRW
jgi:threonine synthase